MELSWHNYQLYMSQLNIDENHLMELSIERGCFIYVLLHYCGHTVDMCPCGVEL
jgi:hypothetical protein